MTVREVHVCVGEREREINSEIPSLELFMKLCVCEREKDTVRKRCHCIIDRKDITVCPCLQDQIIHNLTLASHPE